VEVIAYRPERVKLRVEMGAPGFVVLSDVYYPGWSAAVDGREVKILRADHAFRAVWLDEGRHELSFMYRPFSVRVGLWTTMATLCFWLVMMVTILTIMPGALIGSWAGKTGLMGSVNGDHLERSRSVPSRSKL
jgi:uncharacterized membrane protein YfhO